MYRLVELFDKQVHIQSTPVSLILQPVVVGLEICLIRNSDTWHRIGIEIVIDMQTIHIIAVYDVFHHLTDIIATLFQSRIQQRQSVVLERPLRMLYYHMVYGIDMSSLRLGTIGINPSMQLHTTLMTLLYHPLQGVPVRIRTTALFTSQIVAPRFDATLIEGIALRTYLEDDDITTILLQLVQLVSQRLLHTFGTHALKLSVHALYPCPTELSLLLGLYGSGQYQENEKQELSHIYQSFKYS